MISYKENLIHIKEKQQMKANKTTAKPKAMPKKPMMKKGGKTKC